MYIVSELDEGCLRAVAAVKARLERIEEIMIVKVGRELVKYNAFEDFSRKGNREGR